jgi:predicted Rossmann fold nucleotide-binding protein DprA/Smf involved in DNA uptake
MKVAIIGSRTLHPKFMDILNALNKLDDYKDPELIVSGGATGADTQAELYAKELKIRLRVIKPDYAKFGRRAPLERNKKIVDAVDAIIGFWDGKSHGTAHTLNYAREQGKKVMVVKIEV